MVWYGKVTLETHSLDLTTVAVFKMHLDMDVKEYNDNKTTVRQTEVERFIFSYLSVITGIILCVYMSVSLVSMNIKAPVSICCLNEVSYESDLMCRTYTV